MRLVRYGGSSGRVERQQVGTPAVDRPRWLYPATVVDADSTPDLRQYGAILARRKGIALLVTLTVTGVAVVVALLQSPTYSASAQVLREAGPADPLAGQAAQAPVRELNNEIRVLESTKVRESVAKVYIGVVPVSAVRASVVATDADVIEVSASGEDPEEVARLVNTYVDTYLKFRTEQKVGALLETGIVVSQKAKELRDKVAALSAPLNAVSYTHLTLPTKRIV